MKKWILAAVILVIAGTVISLVAAAAMDFDLSRLDSGNYETNTYAVNEPFSAVAVDAEDEDVVILPSEDGACRVVCLEDEKRRHEVAVVNGTLRIRQPERREDGFHFGVYIQETKITVYLPAGTCSGLSVRSDSGDVSLESLRTENILLETDTGEVLLRDVTSGNLTAEGETGNMTLERVTISGNCSIDQDTGDVIFRDSDAGEISVETDSGDVTGTLLSEKVFLTETDTGDVQVPHSVRGGTCRISTDTGDIRIEVR